jgi:Fimbrial assembly protein (PilN)
VSQQINLFIEIKRSKNDLSALNMLQGLGLIIFCAFLFYAYSAYQVSQLEQQLGAATKSIAAEQNRLAVLTADFARQRSGLTIEQELKKVEAEALAQREIVNALKSGVIGNISGYSEYMRAFARQTLSGLWLSGFSIDGDATQMSISGAALSPELVPAYIMRLNNETVMRGKTFASLQMQLPKPEANKPVSGKTEANKTKAATPQYLEFNLQSVMTSEADK